jgi:AraC family transcriptional activator of pobA
MAATSLEEFYQQTSSLIPEGINKEIGHFNVFKLEELLTRKKDKMVMPYNRRAY